ncbi:hypothetical protein MKX03_024826, partial [Papaver bracteatum]
GLDHVVVGNGLYVVGHDDDVEDIKETTMQDIISTMSRIDKSGTGVCVQASMYTWVTGGIDGFFEDPSSQYPYQWYKGVIKWVHRTCTSINSVEEIQGSGYQQAMEGFRACDLL